MEVLHTPKAKTELCCSFCGKPQSQVKKLIKSGRRFENDLKFICNECVLYAASITREVKQA